MLNLPCILSHILSLYVDVQGSYLNSGLALLQVVEGTVGDELNSIESISDAQLSRVDSYSAKTVILWIIFIVIMPVLFINLLVCRSYFIMMFVLTCSSQLIRLAWL